MNQDLTFGWLLPQLLDLDRRYWKRYEAWQTALQTKTLLPPQPIAFCNPGTPAFDAGIQTVIDLLDQLSGINGRAIADLAEWLLWSLGHPAVPENPLPAANQQLNQIDLEPWIAHPADYLGHLLTLNQQQNRRTNFFPTPTACAQGMAQAATQTMIYQFQAVPPYHGYEPCLGTGRLALEMSNVCRSLSGWELDETLLSIATLNFTLFAPDFAFPLCRSGDLVWGSSLTGRGRSWIYLARQYEDWSAFEPLPVD